MATDDAIDPRYQLFARLRDAGFGMLAWCVVTAGLQTMPDDEYADLVAEVERIATPPPSADLMALVREIAEQDNYDVTYEDGDKRFCRYCDAEAELFWDEDDGGNRYAEVKAVHEPDCLFVRARAIVARLEGNEHGNA